MHWYVNILFTFMYLIKLIKSSFVVCSHGTCSSHYPFFPFFSLTDLRKLCTILMPWYLSLNVGMRQRKMLRNPNPHSLCIQRRWSSSSKWENLPYHRQYCFYGLFRKRLIKLYSYARYNDISVSDRPHIQQCAHKIIMKLMWSGPW